jgi:hypothetical protein
MDCDFSLKTKRESHPFFFFFLLRSGLKGGLVPLFFLSFSLEGCMSVHFSSFYYLFNFCEGPFDSSLF